jgi:hypothetical protein
MDRKRLRGRAIHRSTLETVLAIDSSAVAFWSMDAWLSSPLETWPKYAHRWTRGLLLHRYGTSRATGTRAKAALRKLWREVAPGDWRPVREAWPEPSGQFYWFSGRLRAQLRAVAGELGHATWRVALWLVIRLRAAMSDGRETAIVPNRTTAARLGMSPATVQRAIKALQAAGLVRVVGMGIPVPVEPGTVKRPPRRVYTFCELTVAAVPEDDSAQDPVNTCPGAKDRSKGAHIDTVPFGVSSEDQQQQGGAPAGARRSDGKGASPPPAATVDPDIAAAAVVLAQIGVADNSDGRDLAVMAGTAEQARAWLESERPALENSTNAPGWLVTASREGALPGRPSERAWRIGRAKRLWWSKSEGRWLNPEPVRAESAPSPPPVRPESLTAEDRIAREAAGISDLAARVSEDLRRGDLDEARRKVQVARCCWREMLGWGGESSGARLHVARAAAALGRASADVAAAWRKHAQRPPPKPAEVPTDCEISDPRLRASLERLRRKAEARKHANGST